MQTRRVRLRETPVLNHPFNVAMTDVVQGDLAGCPVVATLAGLASTRPARVQVMLGAPVIDDVFSKRAGDEIYRFWTKFYYDVNFPGRGSAVRISGVLYHQGNRVVYASTPGGPGWPGLIEKAYAVWRGRHSYDRLDLRSNQNAPDGGRVICDLVGRHDMAEMSSGRWYQNVSCSNGTAQSDRALNAPADIRTIARRSAQRPTIAASRAENTGHGIVSHHAYAMVGYRNGRIRLRNPWGGQNANVQISVADFLAEFRAAWQAY